MYLDVLLVDPAVSMKKRYSHFSIAGNKGPSWGLAFMAAVARREGYSADLLDLNITGLEEKSFRRYLAKWRPRIVGLTASTLGVSDAAAVASIVKQVLPDTLTILGGSHVSAVPEETLKNYSQFDLAGIGEGELTLLDLLDVSPSSDGDFSQIDGLAWRDGEEISLSSRRQLIPDLDWLPQPAMDLFPHLGKYYLPALFSVKMQPAVGITTTRGCPGVCTFCANNLIHGRKVRYHNLEFVFEWIGKMVHDYGIREIQLMDDTFTSSNDYVVGFCERLLNSDMNIVWNCLVSARTFEEDTLKLMKRAGCWQMSLGIESANKEILRRMKKGITVEQVDRVVNLAHSIGIATKGFFIMGFPGETHETMQETMDLAMRLPIQDFSMSIFVPYPGTPARKNIERFGTLEESWDKMSSLNVNFVPHGFTREELLTINRASYRKFYFRISIILAYLRRMTSPASAFIMVKGLIGLVLGFLRPTKY